MLLRFASAGRLTNRCAPQLTWLRTYCAAPPAEEPEIDIELKRRWFDAADLDFAHLYAGIVKHLNVHASPIEHNAVQRLWETATTLTDIQRATDLQQRCWLQRALHGQHKPFSEQLSATAFSRALDADTTAAVRLLLKRYQLGLSLTSLSQWHAAVEASSAQGKLKEIHLLWRAMPKNRVSESTLTILVNCMLTNNRPDVAWGYILEWEANDRTVAPELKAAVQDALSQQQQQGEEAGETAEAGEEGEQEGKEGPKES